MVVNAAGPWADDVLARGGLAAAAAAPLLRARNLVLRRAPVVPFAVGAKSEGRFLFLVPWEGRTIVGTSYEPAGTPPQRPPGVPRRGGARLPLGGDRERGRHPRPRGPRPGPGRRVGPLDAAAPARSRGRGRPPGPREPAGGQVHDRARGRRARGGPRRPPPRPLRRLLPNRRDAPSRGRPLSGPLEDRVLCAVRDEMALTLADAVLRRLDLGTAGPPPAEALRAVARRHGGRARLGLRPGAGRAGGARRLYARSLHPPC